MKYKYCLLLLFLIGITACNREPQPVKGDVMGWAPIYSQDPAIKKIASDTPHVTMNAGKIYAKDHFIYQNETGKGIHVIDITHPSSPKEISFIKSAGSTELAIRGHYLYTNNLNDIVVVDISDPLHVKEVSRIANGFAKESGLYPPAHGYFECVDPSKGTVVGWEQRLLHHPTCYR